MCTHAIHIFEMSSSACRSLRSESLYVREGREEEGSNGSEIKEGIDERRKHSAARECELKRESERKSE